MTLAEKFADAQQRIKGAATAPSTSDMLGLYGLYKQATLGDAKGARPGMLDVKGRAKFDAWSARAGLAKDAAMTSYIATVDKLLGT